MKRIKFYYQTFLIILSVLKHGIKSLLQSKSIKFYKIPPQFGNSILKIAKIKPNIIGIENVDLNENYVFVANHTSLFDIPILQAKIPVNFRMIYKKELEKIPFFGLVLKKSPYISIIREESKNAMESINQAIESIKTGTSVVIFPEGTRSKDGQLQEFKRGAFLLAARAGKPIIPITIIGTDKILPKGKLEFNSGEITVIFDKPIPVNQEISRKEEKELISKIFNIMSENLNKYQNN
ncbi:MAG: lysophospholipid acyltransferase family protein [Candidatus Kapaibacteriota bacterium]